MRMHSANIYFIVSITSQHHLTFETTYSSPSRVSPSTEAVALGPEISHDLLTVICLHSPGSIPVHTIIPEEELLAARATTIVPGSSLDSQTLSLLDREPLFLIAPIVDCRVPDVLVEEFALFPNGVGGLVTAVCSDVRCQSGEGCGHGELHVGRVGLESYDECCCLVSCEESTV